jgi:sporulation protein YlmC with PRC-barrel domain
MLQLSQSFLNRPVLGLRTGTTISIVTTPIINPNNLKIEGFYCSNRRDKKPRILLYQDIREIMPQGFVVDDHEALSESQELVRLQDIIKLGFTLIGKPVVTLSKDKIGKVSDYATEVETMYIQKLYVSQPLLKSLTSGSLSIDRSQIMEITNRRIIIADLLQPTPVQATAASIS